MLTVIVPARFRNVSRGQKLPEFNAIGSTGVFVFVAGPYRVAHRERVAPDPDFSAHVV